MGVNVLGLDPVNLTVFTSIVTGFGLAPDLGEPKSTISRQFGAISRPISIFTRRLAGGHRLATHSWLAIALALGLGCASSFVPPIAGLITAFAFMLAIRTILPYRASDEAGTVMLVAVLCGLFVGLSANLHWAVLLVGPPLGVLFANPNQLGAEYNAKLFAGWAKVWRLLGWDR